MSCQQQKSDHKKFYIGVLGCNQRTQSDIRMIKESDTSNIPDFIGPHSKENFCQCKNTRKLHRTLAFDDWTNKKSYNVHYN